MHLTLLRKGKEKKITVELMKFPDQINLQQIPPAKKEDLLGITVGKIPEGLARPNEKGVYIKEIKEDSPAEEGGLIAGDIILEVNMESVHNRKEFQAAVSGLKPGEWVSFYIRRGSETLYRALKIPLEQE